MGQAGQGQRLSWDEWAGYDALGLAGLVRSGELRARDVVQQAAAATAIVNPQLEAALEVFADVVANPDTDGPNPAGALYGVPFFLKDLGSRLNGRRREAGSRLFRGYVAEETDPYVANALSAGLIPLGRATTPESGLTFDTSTDYLGRPCVTRNPWDLAHTPGGSSGGSAALVAAGVTPISMSSDGGGSTRLPAAFCGLVGLKATRGLFPPVNGVNQLASRYGVEGVVTRTVRDTAAAYDYLTRVPKGGTFIPVRPYPGSYLEASRQAPARLRVALSTGPWGFDTPPVPQHVARTREVAGVLEQLGHTVEEVPDSAICDFALVRRTFGTGWLAGSANNVRECVARGLDPAATLGPKTYQMGERALTLDRWAVQATFADNAVITRQFGRFFETYDALLTLTCAVRPPLANGPYSLLSEDDFDTWFERLHAAIRYTSPANESGLPAIALPAGLGTDGLPISVQLYGSFLAEDVLLQTAAQIEAARPEWFNQRPPHHVAHLTR